MKNTIEAPLKMYVWDSERSVSKLKELVDLSVAVELKEIIEDREKIIADLDRKRKDLQETLDQFSERIDAADSVIDYHWGEIIALEQLASSLAKTLGLTQQYITNKQSIVYERTEIALARYKEYTERYA